MDGTGSGGSAGTAIAASGVQYYIIGGTRIKITEHFPARGKRIDEIIVSLITHKISEKAG